MKSIEICESAAIVYINHIWNHLNTVDGCRYIWKPVPMVYHRFSHSHGHCIGFTSAPSNQSSPMNNYALNFKTWTAWVLFLEGARRLAERDACRCGEEKVLGEASTTWNLGSEDHPVGIGNLLGSVNFHGLSQEGFDSFDMFWRVQLFLFWEKTDGWGRCLGFGILDGCSKILRMVGKSWVFGSLREWGERREWG
jgi:hypothetical protein